MTTDEIADSTDAISDLTVEVERLRGYLKRIATGSPPRGEMPSLDQEPNEFRHQMWAWSQKHAREGLREE